MTTHLYEPAWIRSIFDAKICKRGGIVRRKIASVKKHASEEDLVAAVKRRGFHLVVSGDQYVIFCNEGTFQVIC